MKNRRVGTFTLGAMLIAVGAVYLVHLFAPGAVDLLFVMRFWPVVLILLGTEVLISYFINKDDKMRYDGWAIFLIICLIGFAWCMAAGELFLEHSGVVWHNGVWYD